MKTLWRFLHADSLRCPEKKETADYADFTDKNRAPTSVIPTGVEESLVLKKTQIGDVSTPLDMTRWHILASLLLKHLYCRPSFIRRSLFVFERAIQIHLGQQVVRIKFQEP
jgi:hypothetical protein